MAKTTEKITFLRTLRLLKDNRQSRRSFVLSAAFGVIYFVIHLIINITNSYLERSSFNLTFAQMLGPYTISICSSLLIFSLSSFLSQAMRHLSILYYDVFYNAFRIFIIAIIVVQIAGHAQILNLSKTELNYGNIPPIIWSTFGFISYFTVLLTFLSLFWLERFQDICFDRVEDRLPKGTRPDASSGRVIAICTISSIIIGFSKPLFQADYWMIFVAETLIAGYAIYNTLRFYAPLTTISGGVEK